MAKLSGWLEQVGWESGTDDREVILTVRLRRFFWLRPSFWLDLIRWRRERDG